MHCESQTEAIWLTAKRLAVTCGTVSFTQRQRHSRLAARGEADGAHGGETQILVQL